jgi:hypothetical protein
MNRLEKEGLLGRAARAAGTEGLQGRAESAGGSGV